MAWRINVEGVANLLRGDAGRNVRLVHLSVDLVFSGNRRWRPRRRRSDRSGDRLRPRRWSRPSSCILAADPPSGSAANFAADGRQLQRPCRVRSTGSNRGSRKSKPATLYFDEVRTPHYTDCLNELCDAVLASDLAGLFHAGGPRRLSSVSNRPDHQSRRRLRSRSAARLPADRGRPDSAAGRQCVARLQASSPTRWATSRSPPGPCDRRWVPDRSRLAPPPRR